MESALTLSGPIDLRDAPARVPALPRRRQTLPGLSLTLGFALLYLSILVLIPLCALVIKASGMSWEAFVSAVSSPRVLASYSLSLGAAGLGALINLVAGTALAWVLVRYEFPGRKLLDALVDLPIALPTAVAGISLAALYAPKGLLGAPLAEWGIKLAFNPWGVVLALTFIGLPFVVRTVQPVLEDMDSALEEAAAMLGANARHPSLCTTCWTGVVTGVTLALARGVGEYGSVIFIAGNLPGVSEIAPLMIVGKLEQYDYAGASAIALVLLGISLLLLLVGNSLQWWLARRGRAR